MVKMVNIITAHFLSKLNSKLVSITELISVSLQIKGIPDNSASISHMCGIITYVSLRLNYYQNN